MDNKVLYPCSYSSWYDLYSGTVINQESNTIRGFKCFWGLILKHLKAVRSFIHLLKHLYRKTKNLLWQHSAEHVHQGTTSRTRGAACVVPVLMTTADGISLPVQEEASHSLGGFSFPVLHSWSTHKYVLLDTSVHVLVHVSRDFQTIHQELTSADTWKHSWGILKHWPRQRPGPCPREVIPLG